MAIIKCPECGQSVSELAANCPGCGCPINGNIDHCPECGEIVLKTYIECPKCHCPIQQIEKQKATASHFYKMAIDAFNAGKINLASHYLKNIENTDNSPEFIELKKNIDIKLQVFQQKFEEVKRLFEENHQPYPALALINKLIAIESTKECNEFKEKIILYIINEQKEKAKNLIETGKYEQAQTVLSKALSYDPENEDIHALSEEINEKIEKKKRRHKNTIITLIVTAFIFVIGIIGTFIYNLQAENTAWDKLQTSTNLNDYQEFLTEYPHGRHYKEAKELYDKLSSELTAWATVSNSVDKYAVKAFLEKYPNGICASQAKNKLDSLSWIDACNINKPEAYAQYLSDFPNGKYINEAQQKTSQLKDLEISSEEHSQISNIISQFFNGIASEDENQLLGSVESTMTNFLNKRNATKAHVLAFMKQMHAPDMTSISFTVNNDLKIKKTQLSDGEYSYAVTCSVDEKIERTEKDKETFINYGVNFNVDNFMKISSLGLRKISSSTD